jgi:tetratricopeptide (TPR) repeat protein
VLFPHAGAALAQRPQDNNSLKEWALLLYNASWYAWQQGKAGDAEHMATLSMEARQEVFGDENADTLSSMHMVGIARMLGGMYEEAEAMNRQTLALSETLLGQDHPDTLISMSNLALVLTYQKKYEEAEPMNRQTIALKEKVLGREHPDMLTSMSNLAGVFTDQGKYKEAEEMNRETLKLRETRLGREHPDTLNSVYCLAHLLSQIRCYPESLDLYKRAYDGYLIVHGNNHPITRQCRQDYATNRLDATKTQPAPILAPATSANDVVVYTRKVATKARRTPLRKVSKLGSWLAKLGVRSSKRSPR